MMIQLGWGAVDVVPDTATRAGDAALFDAYLDAPDQATRDQARAALVAAGYVDQVAE